MDPAQRLWWRLLEDLPGRLRQVECWHREAAPPLSPPKMGNGGGGGDHLHAVPTLVACLKGVLRCERAGPALDLGPGDVLVLGPGAWHAHAPTRAGSVFFAQGFLATASDVVLGDHLQRFGGRLPREPSRQLMAGVLDCDDPVQRRARCRDLIAQVLAETVTSPGPLDPACARMVHRMWSGLHRGVRVDDLVAASGLSRAQAYRVFTSGYGVPPKAALESARLELAEGLIRSGLGPGAVAEACGFPSPGTFTRAWRRRSRRADTT
jgi:AraC-like DNA-binding protein